MNKSKNNAYIRAAARDHLNGNYLYAIITMVSYGMLAFGLTSLSSILPGDASVFQSVISVILAFLVNAVIYLLRFGLNGCYMKICCGQKVTASDIFSKVINPDAPTIMLAFLRAVIDFICLFPFSYGLQRIVMGYTGSPVTLIVLMTTSLFIYINVTLTLMPVGYLVNDLNEKTVLRVLLLSQWLMKGNKLRLLKMTIYFIPLICIGMLPLFLGLLLVYPYKQCSETCFYLDIASEKSDK